MRLDNQLQNRRPNSFCITKVKGHETKRDVMSGRVKQPDRLGNHRADSLATSGARQHAVCEQL
eukprot:8920271-Karenia_brevis.AAC.1